MRDASSTAWSELLADSGSCGKRVVACGPLPSQSLLVDKILAKMKGTNPACGGDMPPTGSAITQAQYQAIIDWIAAGALKN